MALAEQLYRAQGGLALHHMLEVAALRRVRLFERELTPNANTCIPCRVQPKSPLWSPYNAILQCFVEPVEIPDRVSAGNGLSVGEMMASDKRLASIPVIILTGQTDEKTITRCEKLGARYVAKEPDTWPTLKPMIQEILGGGQAMQSAG